MPKKKLPVTKTGFGVVGTWMFPKDILGGTLPLFLGSSESEALLSANDNDRLKKFIDTTDQYLCEITIKPIRKVERKMIFG